MHRQRGMTNLGVLVKLIQDSPNYLHITVQYKDRIYYDFIEGELNSNIVNMKLEEMQNKVFFDWMPLLKVPLDSESQID